MKSVHHICICFIFASALVSAQNPVPLVNQPLVPDAVVPGGPTFTLTVNGSGFVSGATVNWNGAALATTFVTGSQLTAQVPASELAVAGTASVTATNPAPGGGTSNVEYVSIANSTSPIAFASAVAYSSGGYFAGSVVVADINGDGTPDLLVANLCSSYSTCPPNVGTVAVLLGNGDGTFQSAVVYDTGGIGATSVAVADVNGDGKPDLLVANNQCEYSTCGLPTINGTVGVLLGNGDGTFQTAVAYSSGGYSTQSVAVADVNGDGKLDLIVANKCADNTCPTTSGTVGVLLGNGDGTFQTAVVYNSGGGLPYSVAVADVNGDGKPDLLVPNNCTDDLCMDDGSVGVLLGNGDGTFQTAVTYSSGDIKPRSVAVADVNGDRKPDLLVANYSSVGVLLGNGDGTFQKAVTYGSSGGTAGGNSVAVGDVNGDGKPDLVVANYYSDDVSVLLGNGDGTFRTATTYGSGGLYPGSVALADLNGDGKPDLLVANGCPDANCDTNGVLGVLINVGKPGTTITLASSQNPSDFLQTVTFTAMVTAPAGGMPTGTVSFYDGKTNLGNSNLNGAVATLTTTTLAAGTLSITATYNGDANLSASTSPVLLQVVQGGLNLGPAGGETNSATVTAGGTANYALQIGGGGLSGTATLTCAGAPAGATCTIPGSESISATKASMFTVSVTTSGTSARMQRKGSPLEWAWATFLIGIVLLPLGGAIPRFGQKLWMILLLLLLMLVASCGGAAGSGSGATPAGAYSLTVTATLGATKQSLVLRLIVN